MIEAKIIADSISAVGRRITTMQLVYPRFIHSEFMTHRVFSRNASSSRAIPVKKMIEMVRTNPAMPIHWGKNQVGMQASEELSEYGIMEAQSQWKMAARMAADRAEMMMDIGLHKQVANRILEPFQHIHVVVTATDWDNFFELRAHEDAQPEIHELAIQMRDALGASTPKLLSLGEWHLPYLTEEDLRNIMGHVGNPFNIRGFEEIAKKVSAARCCRVSYLKHDGGESTIDEDIALFNRLAESVPLHSSPLEHQARPDFFSKTGTWLEKPNHGNFNGWVQFRKEWEQKIYAEQLSAVEVEGRLINGY